MSVKWKIVPSLVDNSSWLEVVDAVCDADDDSYEKAFKEGGTAAYTKWDGCVDLVLSGSYLHICNLSDLIERLIQLRDLALAKGFEVND